MPNQITLLPFIAAALGADPAGPPGTLPAMSVWDFALKGGPTIAVIAFCSLVALAIIVERLIVTRRAAVVPPGFLANLKAADAERALETARAGANPIANILAAALSRRGESIDAMREAIGEAGRRELVRLRHRMRLLGALPQVATMLGLLGTILGMIKTFQAVAASGQSLGKTELLARGIFEAWANTAAGLLVAIPVLIAYHALLGRIDARVSDLDRAASEWLEAQRTPRAPARTPDPVRPPVAAERPDAPTPVLAGASAKEPAMLIGRDEPESSIHIDFVPLADVLFNLLIFFLLATTIAQVEREMNVALPSAGAAAPISQALREMIINVDADGRIIVSGRTIEPDELREQIATAVKANPDQKVSIRGDRATAYANIARVLDICKAAGVAEPFLDAVPIGGAARGDA